MKDKPVKSIVTHASHEAQRGKPARSGRYRIVHHDIDRLFGIRGAALYDYLEKIALCYGSKRNGRL